MRKKCLLVCCLLLISTVATSRAQSEESAIGPPTTTDEIRIGAILHLTGEFAIQGEAFREGMELGVEYAKSHGINRPIHLVVEDTQYSALRAVTAAKKLLSVDKVNAAVISTAVEAKAAAPEFERAKVPALVLWDASPELEAIGEYLFSIGSWIPASGEQMARFAAQQLQAKTAVVIHTNTEWSYSVALAFSQSFPGKILATFNENPSETEFRATIAKAKSKGADVLYAPVDASLISFFTQLRQYQFDKPVLTSDIITEDNLQEAAAIFHDVYQSQAILEERPLVKVVLSEYKRKFGRSCTQSLFVAWGFDAVRLLIEAALHAESGRIRESLQQIEEFPGALGSISFTGRKSWSPDLGIFRISGRNFVRQNLQQR